MTELKKLLASTAIATVALGLAAGPASATALTLGTGWLDDQVTAVDTPSDNSPFTFTGLAGQSYQFSVTDAFIVGDTYTITLNGVQTFLSSPGLTATPFDNSLGDPIMSAAWNNPDYSKFALDFGEGNFSFVITGDCGGGCAAGFGYRLDLIQAASVPEPMTLSLFGAGLAGIAAVSRRRKARQA